MRKTHCLVLLSILLSLSIVLPAQNERGDIANRIANTQTTELVSHFSPQVDLSILGVDAVYSRAQAEMVLRRFFKDNAVVDFTLEHQGRSKGDSRYVIGKLTTEQHRYRVTYFLRTIGRETMVEQFRIETE